MKHWIDIDTHNFTKLNLITKTGKGGGYDEYKCSTCGLVGKRRGFSSLIEVNKKVSPCKVYTPSQEMPTKVKVLFDGGNVGLTANKEYDVVPCPLEYQPKYLNDIWVMSEVRKEAVRLLPDEYEII